MKNFQKVIAIIALSGMCLAAPAPSDTDAAPKKAKHHAKKTEAAAPACAACEDIKQLKDQIQAQQAQIDQLKSAQQANPAESDAQKAAAAAAAAQQQAAAAAAAAADASAKANAAQGDVAGLKTEVATTQQEVQKDTKKVDYLEHPASIAYKGIRITPAGFAEATGYYRSHAMLSDQATQFQSIPLEHNANGTYANTESSYNPNLSEFGFTPRDSRIAFRLDADPTKSAKLAAYFEMDFLGAASTANTNQTSSYTPRIRQAWGRVKFDNGWTFTGGQMWSLITLNRRGVDADNSNLWIPNIIEAQYSIGYDWGRFGAMRLGKAIGKNVNFALELTNPTSLTQANNTTTGIAGLASVGNGLDANSLASGCTISTPVAPATQGTLVCTNTPTYSTNMAPDMIVKLTHDSKFGHFEVKGVGRFFRDRVLPTTAGGVTTPGWNNTDLGGGVGAGWVIPVVSKKIDFIAQGLYGKGISRYQDAGQYDFVVRSTDHNLQPLRAFSALAGFETHPTKKTELDFIFGEEYYFRTLYVTNAAAIAANPATAPAYAGYGVPTANNVACYFELNSLAPAGSACSPNNKVLWNGKVYGYYDLFRGPHGTLRYGAEYDYDYRSTWSGTGGLTTLPASLSFLAGKTGLAPKGINNIGFVTMRYIFP